MNRSPAPEKSGPDVSQLDSETLSTVPFPVPRSASFRVYFDPQAYAGMTAHATEDVSFEICGVLVGDWGRDTDGPFVTIRNYVRCDSAAKKFAEVTFTHESWSQINREMDTKFQDQQIVGWYHSHPNFGVFLSDRDLFIQQNFFSGPGQIALVIDPVRKIEGVFEWRNGRALPTTHFWVGTRVCLAPAESGTTGMSESALSSTLAAEEISGRQTGRLNGSLPALTMLAGMGLFLMGWLVSGWRTDWDRRAIVEGTVAHLGIWGLVRPGLEDQLTLVESDLGAVEEQLTSLATDHLKRATAAGGDKDGEKFIDQTKRDWKKVFESTNSVRQHLRHMEKLYSLAPEDRAAIRRFVEQKFLELSMPPPSDRSEKSANEIADDKSKVENSKSTKETEAPKTNEKSSSPRPSHNGPQGR